MDFVKIGAVIVLYNPIREEILENISSFSSVVTKCYIIDNSDLKTDVDKNTFGKIPNAVYIDNKSNLGIAAALNIGAHLAIKDTCDWLLTMDQDSKATEGMIQLMAGAINNFDNIGIISPVHTGEDITEKLKQQQDFIEVDSVMTSGNLLNLQAYKQVGPFNERLFIDYVDHEYCLRLKKNNYKVFIATKANLIHNLGNISVHRIGNTTNHNFVRRYYMTRNRLLVQREYKKDFPTFCKQDNANMWKELVKICLLEKDKLKKIKAFILGFYHFRLNKFGKLN